MKAILPLVLIFNVLYHNTLRLAIVANYQLHISEITEKYCVNKSKPEMHCKGKCHLQKKLKQNDTEKHLPKYLKNMVEDWFMFSYQKETVFGVVFHKILYYPYLILQYTNRIFTIFHPPPL